MDIGILDRRIRIESPQVVNDPDYGPQPGVWAEFATLWANVQEVLPSKGEEQGSGIRISEGPARVRTRYVQGITSNMRAIYLDRGNRVMKIIAKPVELGRKEGLEFMVSDFSTTGEGA